MNNDMGRIRKYTMVSENIRQVRTIERSSKSVYSMLWKVYKSLGLFVSTCFLITVQHI